MSTKIVAHRCGTDKYPQLTINSALESLRLGADIIEADVRLTSDNVPVICHWPDGTELFGESALIRTITYETFKTYRYQENSAYSSISLEQLLSCGEFPVLLHIKDKHLDAQPIYDIIKAHKASSRVIMGLVNLEEVLNCKTQLPNGKILGFISSLDKLQASLRLPLDVIRLWEPWLTKELFCTIKTAKKEVWVMSGTPKKGNAGYTTKEKFDNWVALGVDGVLINEVGFFTSKSSSHN